MNLSGLFREHSQSSSSSPSKDEGPINTDTMSGLIRQHALHRQKLKEENDLLKQTVLDNMGRLSSSYLDSVNKGVAEAFLQEKQLEAEIKALQVETAEFVKRSSQWVALVSHFNASLKEIGDVENWSRSIEADMNDICTKLEYVHNGRVAALETPK